MNHLSPLTPLTSADTMRAVQIEASTHRQSRRRASVSCLAVSGTAEASPCSIPDLPSPSSCLPSLGPVLLAVPLAARGVGTMKALTPVPSLWATGLSAYLALPSRHSDPIHAIRPMAALSVASAPPVASRLRHGMSRLATKSRRNRFVILRTASSPPVALHLASRRRSYVQLRSCDQLPHGLPPCRQSALAERTHPRESGGPELSVLANSAVHSPYIFFGGMRAT